MTWVRMQPYLVNWPGGGPSPVFEITGAENGTAVVELAWDPQALMAPAAYPDALRYYSSHAPLTANLTRSDGSTVSITVPAQTIQLTGNRATWTIPQSLWDGYVQEAMRSVSPQPSSRFQRNLYYRVRLTLAGASQALIWPADAALTGANSAAAPHIGILASASPPPPTEIPDAPAVQAMGGIALIAPNLWGSLISWVWKLLPENHPERVALTTLLNHPTYRAMDVPLRAKFLTLWLFAGPGSRPRLNLLLTRQVIVGSNLTQPALTKVDLRGGRTLIDNLLALLSITPHPDIVAVRAREQLLDDVISEILDPNGQVNQGEAGTCSPTSIQTLLITVNPAEYARLECGLLSSAGSVELAGGATATVPPAIFQLARYPGAASNAFLVRNFSELAFQATLLKYGLGASFPAYDPAAAPNAANGVNTVFQTTVGNGLASDQTKRALDGLFRGNFTTRYLPLTNLAGNQAAQPGIRDGLTTDLPNNVQPMVFAMFWSAPYSFGHAVLGLRRDNGRIFFKNPQYPGSHPPPGVIAGGNAANPPRRYEDPTAALESIAESDLVTWIKGYWKPAGVIG